MFRSLATRLTAAYVFAAIVLTFALAAAVTAFSLSAFGIGARDTIDSVARHAPFEVKIEVARAGSLRAAAPEIAQALVQPGVRVGVHFSDTIGEGFVTARVGPDGHPIVRWVHPHGIGPPGAEGPPPGAEPPAGPGEPADAPGPGGDGESRYDRAYPFGLGSFMHVLPRFVSVANGGTVAIFSDPAPLFDRMHEFQLAILPLGLVAICAAWLIGRLITGHALAPLVETTASLNRFGAGDFTPRPITTTDRNEIGELVRAYNAAAAQVTAAFEERRLAEQNMRQFIADAGHELRTPLTVIMGFIDVLRRRAQNDGVAAGRVGDTIMSTKIYDTMLAESRRMRSLIEKLILLARLENVMERERETVDLGAVAGRVVASLQALESRPRLAMHADSGTLVRGYENELHDAISNLVENAMKYAPDSPVDVRVTCDGEEVLVAVTDRGPGIAVDEQSLIFTRFYRGRDRGDAEGFGLGLAIAARAAERSNGTIALASIPGQGATFSIRFPRATRGEAIALAV